MIKILVTGSNGLLGQKLLYALKDHQLFTLIATAKGRNRAAIKDGYIYEELDISDRNAVESVFQKHKPDCVINTAAMTNVDACETDKENCRRLNVEAVQFLAGACKELGAHLIHLSTDFVFDGEKGPYKEEDEPDPQSFYAQSKLDSERIVEQSGIDWTIIRTIIIYGVVDDLQRSNVVLWTVNSLRDKKTINVISDQHRSPTLAEDLADACIQAALKRQTGLYHVSGKDLMTILECVQQTADFFGLDKTFIKPITTAELNQPAKRPLKTGFIIDKAMRDLNYRPHSFAEGLAIVREQLEKR